MENMMSVVIFALAAITGLLITALSVYLTNGKDLTANQRALIIAIGLFLTWLGSFFFPLLTPNSQHPSRIIIIFGISFSVLFGLTAYAAARFYFALKRRGK